MIGTTGNATYYAYATRIKIDARPTYPTWNDWCWIGPRKKTVVWQDTFTGKANYFVENTINFKYC